MNLFNGMQPIDSRAQNAARIHSYHSVPLSATSPTDPALKVTKKGGVLGKKRGKYKKDSRVTQWRHRAKAKLQAQSTSATSPLANFQIDTFTQQQEQSPSSGDSSPGDSNDADSPIRDCLPVQDLLAKLTFELSHVKNQRICPYSTYDTLRYLSVLRFLEHTLNGLRPEEDVANHLAEVLWVHKTSQTGDRKNSISHTSLLIRSWAKEYRATGKLSEHSHGRHVKTSSKLARSEIAQEAKRALDQMSRPSPAALKDLLLTKIFPKFGVNEPKITENTCRVYMEKWGYKDSGPREWSLKGKRVARVVSTDSEEADTASEETSVLEFHAANMQHTPPTIKPPAWNAPIPSPTTALTSSPTRPAILSRVAEDFRSIHNSSINTTASTPFGSEASMNIHATSSYSEFIQSPPDFPSSTYYPYQFDPAAAPMYNFDMPLTSLVTPQSPTTQRSAYHEQAQRNHFYKPLDHLVPDPPQMMGHRPAFNGLPPTTFVVPSSLMGHFSHDNSFPSQIRRRASTGQQNMLPEPSNSASRHFMPPTSQ